ncbi:hypothetical protein ACERK3_01475 [Phycisphaerales bacterium AB-hyl4]|uniref:Cobalt/nickel transport protein n=1 Tax=Natronomicrosphaera hydrolytica TaxID=3242702 RepID=A0ABV4U026_9BACT
MNKPQLICLWIGIALIVLAGLLPPWVEVYDDGQVQAGKAIGHAWLFAPPEPGYRDAGMHLDYGRLLLIWLIVAGVTGGAIASFRHWQPHNEADR